MCGVTSREDVIKIKCIMDEVLRYKYRGFTINIVLSDAEFSSVTQSLQNTGIRLNATSASEHVGEIERFFRFLK